MKMNMYMMNIYNEIYNEHIFIKVNHFAVHQKLTTTL